MTIFGTMLSTFMITLGVLLAGLATHGRFGPAPVFFSSSATARPEPAKSAAPTAHAAVLQPPKTRFVAVEATAPGPVPAKATLGRAASPATPAARKATPKKRHQSGARAPQGPKPHERPGAATWGWGWNLPIFRN